MRRQRTIYFNDARHYYLFVFEPPMTLEDAWRPVDEVAGAGIDTFVYGVSRVDGLYYPSKAGTQFKHGEHGPDSPGFKQNAYWRTWHNMKSLEERGLDPLRVLIDRAHDKGMDFFASLRLSSHAAIDPAHEIASGGRGWVHREVRDFQREVLRELAVDYPTEGVELDFAAAPGGSAPHFRDENDAREYTPAVTEWVAEVAEMVRGRPGTPGEVGVRVYPTQELNLRQGFDVLQWLRDGSIDWIAPLLYGHNLIDPHVDLSWLIEAAHAADVSVYATIQPHHFDPGREHFVTEHATPAMRRAAVASFREQGADGMYTWFLPWPFGDAERRVLTEMADPDLIVEADKHYVVGRPSEISERAGMETQLPHTIEASDTSTRHPFRLYCADDLQGKAERVKQVRLKVYVGDIVSEDRIRFLLNGESLEDETCLRHFPKGLPPYHGQWLDFDLRHVRPTKGWNTLELVLDGRPADLISPLVVQDVELIVEYGPYPSTPDVHARNRRPNARAGSTQSLWTEVTSREDP